MLDQGSARLHEGVLARRLGLAVGGATGAQYVGSAPPARRRSDTGDCHAVLEREERWRRLRRDLQRTFGADAPQRVAEIIASNEHLLRERPRISSAVFFHGSQLGGPLGAIEREEASPLRVAPGHRPRLSRAGTAAPLMLSWRTPGYRSGTLERRGHSIVERSFPFSRVIAAIAEPILGEGGVVEVAPALLEALPGTVPPDPRRIQTGLGRTGTFLASGGVRAGYYLLSKALGGGVVKISAPLVERSRYVPRFEETYSSTFAGDALSCAVAGRVLDVVSSDDVPGRARDRGAVLRAALEGLREAYLRDVIREVRGRGLLLGLELETKATRGVRAGGAAVDREDHGSVAAAYLLNRHGVRMLPTLSAPNVLRIEPSAWVDDAAVPALRDGLAAFCQAVRDRRVDELLSFLVAEDLADASMAEALTSRGCLATSSPPRRGGEGGLPEPFRTSGARTRHGRAEPWAPADHPPGALFHRFTSLLEMKPVVVFARNLFSASTSPPLPSRPTWRSSKELHRVGYRRQETERIPGGGGSRGGAGLLGGLAGSTRAS